MTNNRLLPKRFKESDIERWQQIADKETRGNLNLWMELALNKVAILSGEFHPWDEKETEPQLKTKQYAK